MSLKHLTAAQLTQFRTEGYVFPFRAVSAEQAADYRGRIEAYEAQAGHDANRTLKIKGNLAFPWLMNLGRNPRILDAVEDVIGPNILLFGASIFAKNGRDPRYVSWHQDSAYFGLDSARRSHGVGGLHRKHGRERLPEGHAAHASRARPASCRDARAGQHARERPEHRRPGREAGGVHRARAGRVLAASRAHGARLGAESRHRSPHRLRVLLHSDARALDHRPQAGDAGARRRRVRALGRGQRAALRSRSAVDGSSSRPRGASTRTAK